MVAACSSQMRCTIRPMRRLSRMADDVSRGNLEAEPAPVGLSIGVARGPAGDSDFAILQARAEAAMYQARRRGRNHYATAAELELAAE